MSHVRCRCGYVYPVLDGRGLCPACVSLTPPTPRAETAGEAEARPDSEPTTP
ncbi:hypothetical protein [Cellulosimicrobium arenosum]|uniref:Uncharacterized protein n=1 Tax=Cellulosimicrobium arenosum TaxID=2708133 RepID=A0A927IZ74_9MICO|nr:hypothetical protein [Cellulosimicrobium arenosum]MBD8078173.1 hypothetical protein [Cellulosimicrobium arenosum]